MPRSKPKRALKKAPVLAGLFVAAVALAVLGIGGMVFGASLEGNNSFCASCHTQPETANYQRFLAAAPVDMASAHNAKQIKCIDCHSGPGLVGRVGAEIGGAKNALLWITGAAHQPGKLAGRMDDANCLKCHQDVTSTSGMDNHFHRLLTRWQAADPNAGGCASCHSGHNTDGTASTGFMTETRVAPVCEACHQALGEGG